MAAYSYRSALLCADTPSSAPSRLVAYPLGKLMAKVLPMRTFTTPRWLGSFEFSLNPGAFNIKEHTLISIMANVAIGQAYALNVIIVQDSPMFYNDPRPTGFGILLVLTTQTIGFGLAGVCRRFLVWPASMIWPQNLVIATILNTFHAEEDGRDGTMSRFRFFSMAAIGAFFYYFIPGFLFQALSYMNWVCWIFPGMWSTTCFGSFRPSNRLLMIVRLLRSPLVPQQIVRRSMLCLDLSLVSA